MMCCFVTEGVRAYDGELTKWVQLPERLAKYSGEAGTRWNRMGGPLLEWRVFSREGRAWSTTARDPLIPGDPAPHFFARADDFEFTKHDTYVKTDDGWLISFRRGEWGGALYWFSEDGLEHRLLGPFQVNQFLRVDDKILAVEGLSHLGISRGSLLEIESAGAPVGWHYRSVKTMPSEPMAMTRLEEGTLWIALFDAVVSLDASGRLETLVHLPWDVRSANSITVAPDRRRAYLGGSFWVTEVDIRTGQLRYLVPRELLDELLSDSPGINPERTTDGPPAFTPPAPDPGLQ